MYGLNDYNGTNKIIIEIYGTGPKYNELINLTKKLNIESFVKFKSPKSLSFFEQNRKNWNMGVSSLGLHRIDCKNAKPIKARDYILMGLPVICTKEDNIMSECNFNHIVSSDTGKEYKKDSKSLLSTKWLKLPKE